jgi:hypothetical protein
MKLLYALCCLNLVAALPGTPITFDETKYDSSSIITRDVCIIGGGSTGTYSAIRLRDMGKSVVVVEREAILGGHTNTYSVPGTDIKIDYGVVVFHDLNIVHNYFSRFNIPLIKAVFPQSTTEYINFQTGLLVANYTPPTPTSLATYAAQLAKYPYVEGGFDLQYPVPPDLLLPFGDFVKKYALEDMVPFIFTFAQGLGDLLRQPTLYVFKNFGSDIIKDLTIGFLTTARHNNHEIYDKALAELGADALISSHVLAVDRPSDSSGVKVLVSTPSGIKLIKASKLLITIPPKLHNLEPFELDNTESGLFGQFGNSAYYTGLLTNTGLPDNTTFRNIGSNPPYNIAHLPGLYSISPTGVPGLFDVKYGSAHAIPVDQVKADILATVALLKNAGLPVTNQAQFAAFNSHTPFELTVPTEAIAGGFYKNLYALQGRRGTWWTGAAFDTHDSSLLWNFTETHVLPGLTA